MPDSRELDVRYLQNLVLPYDVTTKELSDAPPRLVAGANTIIDISGTIVPAPGLTSVGSAITGRADRLCVVETIENPPKIYLIASVFNSGTGFWNLYYNRIDAATGWVLFTVPTNTAINSSTAPHEMVVSRGLVYIRGVVPSAVSGAIIFDGSGGSGPHFYPWGSATATNTSGANFICPTALQIVSPGSWSASTNSVTVNVGWKYAYCFKTITGQLSCRSLPIELATPANINSTGAFTNKKPQVTMTGLADTTNYPFIVIFRTTDGGGTYYYLDTIANTGLVTHTYTDNHRDFSTTNDPQLDTQLDTSNVAPGIASNGFPPPTLTAGTVGNGYYNAGSADKGTIIEKFAGRLWYAIGNRLFYSGNEEIINGIPEECWPNPLGVLGNYYILPGQVRWVKATKKVLYIGHSAGISYIIGQDKTNFFLDTLVTDIKAAYGHSTAVAAYRDSVFFLSSDLQVYGIQGLDAPLLISGPLGSSLRTLLMSSTAYEVGLEIFSRDGNSWLVVSAFNRSGGVQATQFVYDLNRTIWFTPWTKNISAMVFARLKESDPQTHLLTMVFNQNANTSTLAYLDSSVVSDAGTTFAGNFTTNLFTVPAGDHINELRRPAHNPMLSYLKLERTKFGGDADPTVSYRLDELSGSTTSVTALATPPFNVQHSTWKDHWYSVQKTCFRTQISVSFPAGQAFEIQNIGFIFQPEMGA